MADKYIVGLYQELEQEVIASISKSVKATGRYTETAELMAKSMVEQGYSAEKIQAEVMRKLRADKAYQKAVAENTKAHKAEIQKIIDETVKAAQEAGDAMVAEAGNMAWNNDLSMWQEHGVNLKQPNSMSQLIKAFQLQAVGQLRNLTRSMGFKNTLLGTTGVLNAYQREMDLALLKVATGTFSYDQAVNDCVHRLAQSGLRSIDYASGRTYQIDTAVRMSVRTGLSQLAGKVMEVNLKQTGQDLVITSQHMGSRPEHAPWQNKVFSYSGKNKKYPDFFKETGYGTVGGLKGVNCTHDFYPFWEGSSVIPDDIKEPPPKKIDGKEYDYYQANQQQRKMERSIRATKREIEAQRAIGGDTTELRAKLRKQMAAYNQFSKKAGLRAKENRLRVASNTSNLKKTGVYKRILNKDGAYGAKSINNLNFPFNENATFEVNIKGVDASVCRKIQEISKDITKKGALSGKEYAYAFDRYSGKELAFEVGEIGECMSREFFKKLIGCKENSIILIHNHTNNKGASYVDINTALFDKSIYASVMTCNNGDIYYMADKIKNIKAGNIYDLVFSIDADTVEKELKKLPNYHIVKENMGALASAKEEIISKIIIREYFREVQ